MDKKPPEIVSKNLIDGTNMSNLNKDELLALIKSLIAHNTQLKNIIAKKSNVTIKETKQLKPFDFAKYNFQHIALKFLYLGWDYRGYVTQEDTADTIEHHLFNALLKTKLIKDRTSSNYHRCGRTDKGVSSFGQVISIDVRSSPKENSDGKCASIDYCKILNRVLPENIQCLAWAPVDPDFSARFNCLARTYKYYFPKGLLNIERMKIASQKLLGVHDFRNFCKMDVGNGVVEFIRNISEVLIEPIAVDIDEYSIFVLCIKSKAFLWHQIRCIVGLLFLIGQGKEDPDIIDDLFDVENNPRKPDYSMASEVPLNLFSCEYEDIKWIYEKENVKEVIQQLNATWTTTAVKQTMVKDMLVNLKNEYGIINDELNCLSNQLLPGAKTKIYVPVMKRPTCESLEEKLKHFSKRKKIEINKNSE